MMEEHRRKKVIGITGGTGCGKSVVLDILKNRFGAGILQADHIGHDLMAPGGKNYEDIIAHFGRSILDESGNIDRNSLSKIVFGDPKKMEELNGITHPNIEQEFIKRIALLQEDDTIPFIAFEAALIIECGYKKYLDELWYVYADEQTRIDRLREGRGYSEEKSRSVMKSQLSEEEFIRNSERVIDNSGSPEETYEILRKMVEEVL